MRRLLFFMGRIGMAALILSGWAADGSALARDTRCPAFEPPAITVVPLFHPPRYDTTQSVRDIYRLLSGGDPVYAGVREVPVGITSASLRVGTTMEMVTRSDDDAGIACAQISQMELQLEMTDAAVYIARELPFGSCGYDVVLAHESLHVAVDRALLIEAADLLRSEMPRRLREIGVIDATRSTAAEARLRQTVNLYLEELSADLAAERERRQRQIDNPNEYARLGASCNGEIRRIISESLRP